jgi:hypothetical protein
LHIALGVTPTAVGQFKQTQMANDIVENQSVLEITPNFVSVLCISIKIKISNEHTEIIIISFKIVKPINKKIFG